MPVGHRRHYFLDRFRHDGFCNVTAHMGLLSHFLLSGAHCMAGFRFPNRSAWHYRLVCIRHRYYRLSPAHFQNWNGILQNATVSGCQANKGSYLVRGEVSGRHISVDAPFVEGEDNSLLDVLVNDDSPMADRSLVNESLAREIDRALSTLTEREKDIIQMFFGINTQEMTLEEIGDKFGLTRERVRQIKEKAIRRLRQNSRSKLLKSYLG